MSVFNVQNTAWKTGEYPLFLGQRPALHDTINVNYQELSTLALRQVSQRWVFDEIMRQVGTELDRELQLAPLSVLARHYWPDGEHMDLCADPLQSEAEVERFGGAAEAERFRRFCNRARALYDTLEAPFMRGPAPQMGRFMSALGFSGLALLTQLGPMRSLWRQLQSEFANPRLRQLFGRYATYCGSSPWEAPATLMLIAQVEMDLRNPSQRHC